MPENFLCVEIVCLGGAVMLEIAENGCCAAVEVAAFIDLGNWRIWRRIADINVACKLGWWASSGSLALIAWTDEGR